MATVLLDRTIEDLDIFYVNHGTKTTHYHKNGTGTAEWTHELEVQSRGVDAEPLSWVQAMLQPLPAHRPTISQVIASIADAPVEQRYFCHRCFDDEHPGEAYEDEANQASTDLVTETLLQTHLQRDHVNEGIDDESEETVTAQFLEDVGAVTIANDKDSASESDSDAHDSDELPSNDVAPAEVRRNVAESRESPLSGQECIPKPPDNCTTPVKPAAANITEPNLAPRPALKSQASATADVRRVEKQVTFAEDTEPKREPSAVNDSHAAGRFSGLRADRRPSPSSPEAENNAIDEQPIIAPEPLRLPSLDLENYYPLPRATLVPSYVLAGSNRFDMKEVRASEPALGSYNLFVYGRLMFPSALRGFAARSLEGVYSPQHQRRLVPSSTDWSRADTSIKRAAEVMTPARLKDYDAWRPSGFDLAAMQESSRTREILATRESMGLETLQPSPAGEVTGFLILGLTEEALRYCDLIFCSDYRTLNQGYAIGSDNESASGSQKADSGARKPLFERRRVTVDIQLSTGQLRSISAATYVCKKDVQLWHPWRPETFVRGCGLQNISKVETHDWRGEETSLATVMKLNYALVGDELCAAILNNDRVALHKLLDNFDDADARCRIYGTPLQAAISKGSHEIAQLLLDYGADPSKSGGKYGTPLIAATIGSRKSITRMLLKHRADVFGTDKKHVSALYQAVGHGDYAITEMLLEAGAWLSQDYGEIEDLACEKRDPDLKELLHDYDIRDIQKTRLESANDRGQLSDGKSKQGLSFVQISSHVAKFVLRKFIVLSSEPGSWRGRKGVALTRAALAAGAPPVILEHLRNALDPISKLIDLIKAADKRHDQAVESKSFETGRIEELPSDDESEVDSRDRRAIRLEIPQTSSRSRSPSDSTGSSSAGSSLDLPGRISRDLSPKSPRLRADSVHSHSPTPNQAGARSPRSPSRKERSPVMHDLATPRVGAHSSYNRSPSSSRDSHHAARPQTRSDAHLQKPRATPSNPRFLVRSHQSTAPSPTNS